MNINTSQTLSQGLSLLTYNGDNIVTPKENQLNIFMGIGLWSLKDGLSEGLPVDVMQMLLSATMMRSRIIEANPGKISKVMILIADSMAIREGAEKNQVAQLVQIYKKSLEPFLDLLNIKDCSEILLSSELESCSQYGKVLESVENSQILKQLKIEDQAHHAYVRTQTAITRYMNLYGHAGIKVGWICAESSKQLHRRVSAQSLMHWDELKFDRWCQEICPDSTMQYLYSKAGLKQSGHIKSINVTEGCPYTAYPRDRRYIVQTQGRRKDIKTVCLIQKRVAAHWNSVAEVCSSLMQTGLVHSMLLPKDCVQKSNAIATVYNMLNHWANPPLLSSRVVSKKSASPLLSESLSDCIYNLSLEDSYRKTIRLEMTLVEAGDIPKIRINCVVL